MGNRTYFTFQLGAFLHGSMNSLFDLFLGAVVDEVRHDDGRVDRDGWRVAVSVGLFFENDAFVGPGSTDASMVSRDAHSQEA